MPQEADRSRDAAIVFGPFQLDPEKRRLTRDGQPVQLGSRALDILQLLVEKAGQLVSKEELIERVWPKTRVEEGALRVHVTALRKTLSDGRPGARDIVNVPGRGYQFVTPLAPADKPIENAEVAPFSPVKRPPAPGVRVIGRQGDVDAIVAAIGSAPCLTIVGTGGIGKTTVALVVAERLGDAFKEGAAFVDLAPIASEGHVLDAIASAVAAPGVAGSSVQALASFLEDSDMLLVIDNCEHLVAEVADVLDALTRQAQSLRVLSTSREPLRFPAEHLYRLPPLRNVDHPSSLTAENATEFPAIALFIERASASSDAFELDDDSAVIIAGICRQLDGLALAIEMAATRTDTFGVADIAAMLDDRFSILHRRRRTLTERHDSLLATLDWSYDMLRMPQRETLHRISAFAARFTVEDAVAVASDKSLSKAGVIECLADLVDRSFITADLGATRAFYRLYETMREYAREKARDAQAADDVARRHAECLAAVFDKADADAERSIPTDWLNKYGRYLDDVRSALDWAFGPAGDVELGISLTANAATLWTHLSLLNELRARTERALAVAGRDVATGTRREMKLYAALSYALVNLSGPTARGSEACEAALHIARRIGADSSQAKALLALWNGCFANGKVRRSLDYAEEFMSVARRLGSADVLVGHRMLGSSHFYLGDVALAREHMEKMVSGYGATAHQAHMARFGFGQLASGRGLLAMYLCYQGLLDQGMDQTRRSVREALESSHAMTICGVLATTSIKNAIYAGCLTEAREYTTILSEQAESQGLTRWGNLALGYDGILLVHEGDWATGLTRLAQAAAQVEDPANTRSMFILSEYAVVLGKTGDPRAGLALIDDILERLADTGERWYHAELYRSRAQILAASEAPAAEVIQDFERALSEARGVGALLFQLRAVIELAHYLDHCGKSWRAMAVLGDVLAMFDNSQSSPALAVAEGLLLDLRRRAAEPEGQPLA